MNDQSQPISFRGQQAKGGGREVFREGVTGPLLKLPFRLKTCVLFWKERADRPGSSHVHHARIIWMPRVLAPAISCRVVLCCAVLCEKKCELGPNPDDPLKGKLSNISERGKGYFFVEILNFD